MAFILTTLAVISKKLDALITKLDTVLSKIETKFEDLDKKIETKFNNLDNKLETRFKEMKADVKDVDNKVFCVYSHPDGLLW